MKRIIIFVVLIITLFCCPAFAEDEFEQRYQRAAAEFYTEMPDSVRQSVDEQQDVDLIEGVKSIFSDILNDLKSIVTEPVKIFCSLILLVLLTSVINGFCFEKTTQRVCFAVCGLLIAGVLAIGAGGYFEELFNTISDLQQLSVSFVPAFAGVCASGGLVASSAGYAAAALASTQVVSLIVTGAAKPLIGIMLAIATAGTITDWMDSGELIRLISKTVKWLFTLGSTAFLIITTLQTTVTAATDTATLAASRFVFSSVVPVVGSSLSESSSAVFGSLKVVSAGVGSLGILSVAAVAIPALIKYLLFTLSLKLSSVAAGWFGLPQAEKLISGFSEAVSLCAAAIASLTVMLIFMTAVMITAGG